MFYILHLVVSDLLIVRFVLIGLSDIFIISNGHWTFDVIDLFKYHSPYELVYSEINSNVSSFQAKETDVGQVLN